MKKLFGLLLLLPTLLWANNIPVTDSSSPGHFVHTETTQGTENQVVEIAGAGGASTATVTAVGLKVDLSTTQVVNSTINVNAITQPLPTGSNTIGAISNTGFAVTNAPAVVLSTNGVNGSTTSVVNAVGTTLNVVFPSAQSVTATNTGFNVNNAPAVILSTAGVNGSTTAVTNAVGTTLAISGNLTGNQNVTVNTALPAGANAIGTVVTSTAGVNGSTIAVTNAVGTTLAISGSINNTGFNVNNTPAVTGSGLFNMTGSTVGIVNGGTPFAVGNSTIAVIFASAQTVVQSTAGVNGSTIAVTNANGTTLAISGSISNTGFNVNNTPAVTQSGVWSTANSTNAVVQPAGTFFGIANSTIGVVGINLTANNTVLNSTAGVVNGGTPFQTSNSTNAAVGTLSNNGAAATSNMEADLPAVAQNQYANNGTAYTQGRNAALNIGTNDGGLRTVASQDITSISFSLSTGPFSMATSTADFAGFCGNGVSTTMITGIQVSCTQTTAGNVPVAITKRSAGYVAAWSSMTVGGLDSNYAVINSTPIIFTAFPHASDGAIVTNLYITQVGCMAAATAAPNDILISPRQWNDTPLVLRKATECVGLNTQSTAVSGNKWTVTFLGKQVLSP